MQIALIGCGRVGLVTGAGLAQVGHRVLCTDSNRERVSMLRSGGLPVHEPHLQEIVRANVGAGRLSFADNLAEALDFAEVVFVCASAKFFEDGNADLAPLDSLARSIALASSGRKVVVLRGTVPVGTARQMKYLLQVYGRKTDASFEMVSNPQFLREGTAVHDFLHPNFVLLGMEQKDGQQLTQLVHKPILEGAFPCPLHPAGCSDQTRPKLLQTSLDSAELIKHASNSFLALKISYANALANLCERVGADVQDVTEAMGLDPRIGGPYLRAGLGFGGFRLTMHLRSLIQLNERLGLEAGLFREVDQINQRRVQHFLECARKVLWVLRGKRVGLLGLAYKPDTDDMSYSPSLALIRLLMAEGASACAHDPFAGASLQAVFPGIDVVSDSYDAARGADALMILTEAEAFRQLDWKRIRDSMARPVVLDGRNLLDSARMRSLGFEYHGIGRACAQAATET